MLWQLLLLLRQEFFTQQQQLSSAISTSVESPISTFPTSPNFNPNPIPIPDPNPNTNTLNGEMGNGEVGRHGLKVVSQRYTPLQILSESQRVHGCADVTANAKEFRQVIYALDFLSNNSTSPPVWTGL